LYEKRPAQSLKSSWLLEKEKTRARTTSGNSSSSKQGRGRQRKEDDREPEVFFNISGDNVSDLQTGESITQNPADIWKSWKSMWSRRSIKDISLGLVLAMRMARGQPQSTAYSPMVQAFV